MKIAIYSGSFDPIHSGHAAVANYVAQWGGVDEVWLLVSPLNPLKKDNPPSDNQTRLDMAEIVASHTSRVKASAFEFDLPLPSFTYNTLKALAKAYPQHSFRLIIGSDNWGIFHKWRNFKEILEEFGVIIYPRPGYPEPDITLYSEEAPAGNATYLADAPTFELSSTMIRRAVKEGKDINYLVPPEVADYISLHSLYK